MKITITVGAINEKGVGKLQKDMTYRVPEDVPEYYAKAYIERGWAKLADDNKECHDPKAGVTKKEVVNSPKEKSSSNDSKKKDEGKKKDKKDDSKKKTGSNKPKRSRK